MSTVAQNEQADAFDQTPGTIPGKQDNTIDSITATATMGVGISACKGVVAPAAEEKDGRGGQALTTVTRLPFLPQFEDRPPFKPTVTLCDADSSLLKALTHHRTPFAVVDMSKPENLTVIHASGGFVAGMRCPVESIEGTKFTEVLKKGLKPPAADVERLAAAIRAGEVCMCVIRVASTCLSGLGSLTLWNLLGLASSSSVGSCSMRALA